MISSRGTRIRARCAVSIPVDVNVDALRRAAKTRSQLDQSTYRSDTYPSLDYRSDLLSQYPAAADRRGIAI